MSHEKRVSTALEIQKIHEFINKELFSTDGILLSNQEEFLRDWDYVQWINFLESWNKRSTFNWSKTGMIAASKSMESLSKE